MQQQGHMPSVVACYAHLRAQQYSISAMNSSGSLPGDAKSPICNVARGHEVVTAPLCYLPSLRMMK